MKNVFKIAFNLATRAIIRVALLSLTLSLFGVATVPALTAGLIYAGVATTIWGVIRGVLFTKYGKYFEQAAELENTCERLTDEELKQLICDETSRFNEVCNIDDYSLSDKQLLKQILSKQSMEHSIKFHALVEIAKKRGIDISEIEEIIGEVKTKDSQKKIDNTAQLTLNENDNIEEQDDDIDIKK